MAQTHRTPFATILLVAARGAWLIQPITVGTALADTVDGWGTAPSLTAAALAWSGWVAGVLALLAPRPIGFTALRVVAPSAAAVAALCASHTATTTAIVAVISGSLAAALGLNAAIADACADGLAYGTETRAALRAPAPLTLLPIPLAVAILGVAPSVGAMLVANRRYLVGTIVLVIAAPLAVFAFRSLRALDRRWLVTVPAGVVIVDAMTLAEPVLIPRERVRHVGVAPPTFDTATTVDLRNGALVGSIELTLDEPLTFGLRRGRSTIEPTDATQVLITPLRVRDSVAHVRSHLG